MNVPAASYNPSPYLGFPMRKRVALGFALPEAGGDTGAGAAGGGFWDWLSETTKSWSETGQKILLAQNVPTTYTKTGPGGTVTYTQQSGQVPIFGASEVGGTIGGTGDKGMGMLLIAGVGVFLVMMMAKR